MPIVHPMNPPTIAPPAPIAAATMMDTSATGCPVAAVPNGERMRKAIRAAPAARKDLGPIAFGYLGKPPDIVPAELHDDRTPASCCRALGASCVRMWRSAVRRRLT